jgi:ubiquinone/menaquinone biosynthesis C-methylase UbiE
VANHKSTTILPTNKKTKDLSFYLMDNSRFDEEAKTWDERPLRIKRSVLFAERLSEFIKTHGYQTGMDFGAGTGVTSFMLANELASITLIDYSSGMVEQINKKLAEKNVTNLKAHCINLLDPDVSIPETFDIIFSILTLHHIEDTERLLEVFHRYLNPGGMVVLVDLDTEDGSFHAKYPDFDGHLGFDRSALSDKLKAAGFQNMSAEDFYMYV